MGTRSLTRVHEVYGENETCIINMYRQFDGYPDGHGQELVEFMEDRTIGNGIPCGQDLGKFSNGPGCFAAQLVANFKTNDEPGGFYLYPPDATDCGQEYEYDIYIDPNQNEKGIRIKVTDYRTEIFNGNFEDFKTFCLGTEEDTD